MLVIFFFFFLIWQESDSDLAFHSVTEITWKRWLGKVRDGVHTETSALVVSIL